MERLPTLLAIAWLLPLASFTIILLAYSAPQLLGLRVRYATQKIASYIAVGAIVTGFLISAYSLFAIWLPSEEVKASGGHHSEHHAPDDVARLLRFQEFDNQEASSSAGSPFRFVANVLQHADKKYVVILTDGRVLTGPIQSEDSRSITLNINNEPLQVLRTEIDDMRPQLAAAEEVEHFEEGKQHATNGPPFSISGDWYALGVFGKLKLTIGYYIDTLTMVMFCMVTLIASCVHIYAMGYMHDELHDYVDHEVHMPNGEHLHRRGRYHRFFQYLSLFSFSMLGIVISGNLAMTFVFWELVGICSYFLIGFYIERHSASTAANKAFIVNRVGDFGMLIGLMALWSSIGTFNFGDMTTVQPDGAEVTEAGLFTILHPEAQAHKFELEPPEGMSYWMLVVAGVGIFCGCVGKSAQFPLHVWLPDAMEGPTPVSALVHSATMVAAGVFLVGRAYPIFTPEALLVIAVIGCITLFLAATIAVTAVDIKRVLAYSTVSQLGFMMLALGLGGWVAGLFHLITHAFFKSLLFLCSGSVIHAVHTNDMRQMGGLRHKMPITAYTMLIGCLAIAGVGIPFVIGFSGFHSKDVIVEQAINFGRTNGGIYWIFVVVPLLGALMTSFYMFRLWYMTFAGPPRDHHRYDHAHESPWVMAGPLVLLAVFAVCVGWPVDKWTGDRIPGVEFLLAKARPIGQLGNKPSELIAGLVIPDEHASHEDVHRIPAGISAILVALAGIAGATVVYVWEIVSAASLRRYLNLLYHLTWNKWWFDELYDFLFVRPTLAISKFIARVIDRGIIDSILHGFAWLYYFLAALVAQVGDKWIIDNTVDTLADETWNAGLALRTVQTGRLRQYVMFIVVCTIVLFVAATLLWSYAVAG